MLHPVTFSIPEEKIVRTIPPKTKLVSSLIPGNLSTYIYNTEEEYYNEYRSSYFAKTTKKAGWDCMRHYEIMANGCIPYFPGLEKCPVHTMALLPKDLLFEGNALYSAFSAKKELTDTDKEQYTQLVKKQLEYTRTHLTTRKMAAYILQKANLSHSARVLYLSKDTGPDYLRCVTLHGFKELLGPMCHDYPKIPHIYKSKDIQYSRLYGKGITYTNVLDSSLHDDSLDTAIEEKIKQKFFDCVVYGSYHRGMPFLDLVNTVYKPNEVILLCGEDIHRCNYNDWVKKGYTVFVREL